MLSISCCWRQDTGLNSHLPLLLFHTLQCSAASETGRISREEDQVEKSPVSFLISMGDKNALDCPEAIYLLYIHFSHTYYLLAL